MQHSAYYTSQTLDGKRTSIEKLNKYMNWQTNTRKESILKFTKFGTLEIAENVIPIQLFRKINTLYSSINEAKKVLLKYKAELSTTENVEHDCITPLMESKKHPMLFYKREDLTSIKAYKIRGALYQMNKIIEENNSRNLNFIAASTGNHALGVLKAAEILNVSNVTICISKDVTKFKREKLQKKVCELKKKDINAQLVIDGENFDHANKIAKYLANTNGNSFYIDPYNNHNAVAGQGTIGLELLSQLENKFNNGNFDQLKEVIVIVPIGGGGLISGTACALKTGISNSPQLKGLKLRIIGVKLEDLSSKYGDAIKVKTVGEHNSECINHFVEKQITINDKDMKKGIGFVYRDINAKVEGASAGTLKPVLDELIMPSSKCAVICLISGGNVTL